MAHSVTPFNFDPKAPRNSGKALRGLLSPELLEACGKSPFLVEYLKQVPLDEIGMPSYYEKPPRGLVEHNLIYPIDEGLFVHIYPDTTGMRDHHIAIEPTTVIDIDYLMPEIETRLVSWAEDIGRLEDEDEKRKLLLQILDTICTTTPPQNGKRKPDKILISPLELEAVRYRVIRDKIGLGVLQPLLLDPYIEDISCSGVGHIFIEHKIFKSVEFGHHLRRPPGRGRLRGVAGRVDQTPRHRAQSAGGRRAAGRLPYQHRLRAGDFQARQQLHHP